MDIKTIIDPNLNILKDLSTLGIIFIPLILVVSVIGVLNDCLREIYVKKFKS